MHSNITVDKVDHGFVDEKSLGRRDDSYEELNQHQRETSHSQCADFRDQILESPEKSFPVPIDYDHDNAIEAKPDFQERNQSRNNDRSHHQGEMEELHGSNSFKTSSQSQLQTFENEMGTEDSPNSQESHLTESMDQGAGDSALFRTISLEKLQDDSVMSSICGIEKEATDRQTEQSLSSPKSHWLDTEPIKDDSPGEKRLRGVPQSDLQFLGRSARGSVSSMTGIQISVSPEGSPLPLHSLHDHKQRSSQQGFPDPSYEPRSHRERISSPERFDVHTEVVLDHLSPLRKTTSSTHGIRNESLKSHHSSPVHRKRNRSESRSPSRRRDSPTRHRGSPTRHRVSHSQHRVSSTRRRHLLIRHRVSPPGHRGSLTRHRHSPTRLRDSYAYQRDDRDRNRSRSPNPKLYHGPRSPYSRAHYRPRSPYSRDHHGPTSRQRQSPRHRSPHHEHHNSHHRSSRRAPWSPPSNRKTGLGKPGRNLFVAGFSFVTSERDLERKFSRYGRVQDLRIVRDKRSGDSRGFGFLTLDSDENADAAIRDLDETEWNGRIILVEKSKT
ncbi:uncharacterized protein LOC126786327 isoform X2 [Argentina anserina]|uniref:uncharacterized protein LOC126786327 isoform X2 n=1 Tax=Argentina anserina TaxID=57926 RepID=UPI0021766A36|nr:uncharacterized protein LOC126786327 isoform X2 [Potentilla anserina]